MDPMGQKRNTNLNFHWILAEMALEATPSHPLPLARWPTNQPTNQPTTRGTFNTPEVFFPFQREKLRGLLEPKKNMQNDRVFGFLKKPKTCKPNRGGFPKNPRKNGTGQLSKVKGQLSKVVGVSCVCETRRFCRWRGLRFLWSGCFSKWEKSSLANM